MPGRTPGGIKSRGKVGGGIAVATAARRSMLGASVGSYKSVVLADSPINFWTLMNGSAAGRTDLGSQANNMANTMGTPAFPATGGPFGQGYAALNVGAANRDMIFSGLEPASLNTSAWTLECIATFAYSFTTAGDMIELGDSTGQRSMEISGDPSDGVTSQYPPFGPAPFASSAAFHHFVVTGSTGNGAGTGIIYIDGASAFSAPVTWSPANVSSFGCHVGGAPDAGGNPNINVEWHVCMVAIYGVALSPARIAAHYAAFTGGLP